MMHICIFILKVFFFLFVHFIVYTSFIEFLWSCSLRNVGPCGLWPSRAPLSPGLNAAVSFLVRFVSPEGDRLLHMRKGGGKQLESNRIKESWLMSCLRCTYTIERAATSTVNAALAKREILVFFPCGGSYSCFYCCCCYYYCCCCCRSCCCCCCCCCSCCCGCSSCCS